MDFMNVTLAGLAAIGAVNVLLMWKPEIDSKWKFIVSLVVAFAILFIPEQFGNVILNNLRQAIEVAFAASGLYKLATKAGSGE